MNQPFNKLSDAQAERLAMLTEEAGEVAQAVSKILRHGYNSCHPHKPDSTNLMNLESELCDLIGVTWQMCKLGDLSSERIEALLRGVWPKKLKYSHHQVQS